MVCTDWAMFLQMRFQATSSEEMAIFVWANPSAGELLKPKGEQLSKQCCITLSVRASRIFDTHSQLTELLFLVWDENVFFGACQIRLQGLEDIRDFSRGQCLENLQLGSKERHCRLDSNLYARIFEMTVVILLNRDNVSLKILVQERG